MGKTLLRICTALLAAIGCAALVLALWFFSNGISAKPAPGRFEAAAARRARSLGIPRSARRRSNPVTWTADAVHEGLAHFADHCAVCHGNDGSGDSEMGRGLYPRAPDMRSAATQSLSDGELFYIIENGVRLTGMPAWGSGTPEGEAASWRLVHFIRHLPKLTDAELDEMKELNPKSPDEWREEEETREFLDGEAEPPRSAPTHDHGAHK